MYLFHSSNLILLITISLQGLSWLTFFSTFTWLMKGGVCRQNLLTVLALAGTTEVLVDRRIWRCFWQTTLQKIECNLKRARSYTYTEIINCTGTEWEQQMKLINQLLFQNTANKTNPKPPISQVQGLKAGYFLVLCSSLSCIWRSLIVSSSSPAQQHQLWMKVMWAQHLPGPWAFSANPNPPRCEGNALSDALQCRGEQKNSLCLVLLSQWRLPNFATIWEWLTGPSDITVTLQNISLFFLFWTILLN